jgi:hypothetical protein
VGKRFLDSLRERWLRDKARGPGVACSSHLSGPGADGACSAAGPGTDLRADLASGRGVLVAVVEVRGGVRLLAHTLIDHLIRAYADIPPDVDRLVALRATLDLGLAKVAGAEPAHPQTPVRASVLVAALHEARLSAVNSGDCRAFVVRSNGRIDRIRLEPSAQRDIAPSDRMLFCSAGVCDKMEELDLALSLYSRGPGDAANHVTTTAVQRGAQGAILAVVFGPQLSLLESVLGRSSDAST